MNKMKKRFLIEKTIAVVFFLVLILAGLTKAGVIPNYLGISFLSKKSAVEDRPDYKPIIYLYSQKEQQTTIKINYKNGRITVSYPKYKDGWDVVAHPDGKIINSEDKKEYSYLFWEGVGKTDYDMTKGFVVKGEDSVNFLQESLAKLGLMPKEYNEFIVYWLPQMLSNKYNLIHFATKAEYDDRIVLDVKPKPDSVLRIFMVFKKLDKFIEVAPQEFKPFERKGFAVVEWGGTEYADAKIK
ncbi:MAG: hypothetical protein LBL61_01605 [Elusimicrobiota bacterium]|jgi:hypothetical protein|nr:hypothetical protein [Elusimicrobiota bacterium]